MTYLQAVNAVLKRLREDTVASVSTSTYSALIGELVNDAKRLVEDSWNWSHLRTEITVTTAASTASYALTDSGQRVEVQDAWNNTSNRQLQRRPESWYRRHDYTSTIAEGDPYIWVPNGFDASNDYNVKLYPTPDGVYDLKFACIVRQDDLTSDSTEITVPSHPVVQMALALAARERGEVGGMDANVLTQVANKALNDAIALDSLKYPDELVFEVG